MPDVSSVFSSIKFHYYFLKFCGFFPLTINFKNPQKADLHSSRKDIAAVLISVCVHGLCLVLDLANEDFSAFDDSKITKVGFILSRFTTLMNCALIPILGFVNRHSISNIVFNIYAVDQRVR